MSTLSNIFPVTIFFFYIKVSTIYLFLSFSFRPTYVVEFKVCFL